MTVVTRTTTSSLRAALRTAAVASSSRSIARTFPLVRTMISSSTSTALRMRSIAPAASPAIQRRTMFIQTESTPNEDSLKFLPGRQVMESGTHEFLDTRSSMASPLAKKLFNIPGVVGVFYGPDFVTVSKDAEHQWSTLKPEIYSSIMEFFTADQPLFTEPGSSHGSSDTVILDTDSEVVAMIKELLDTRVRPAIQEDGGDLEYRGFGEETDGIVKVKLKGSCRGCDSSTVTLKSGIERMLKHYIPEVNGVEQVLDPEEEIALDEFAKLEQKLDKDRQKERDMGFSL
ncbi:related to NFU-1 protein (iron homeostasis) [Melanopsichium pennsylvanicum]|uniref:Related to NFU-1 protein (Iron homeostasis) n=2 Tax=Melanopsichium pennsylvanicum TaxID=63383 RepID=A0AAJ4XSU1_9BASI|nr:related to NFU-1 protein (iron homeostasis) [Melanopsichium pennsylvanicum 4]SNX86453.1 related to NFU-1 protein (iron homeostasis) [Melanopsichium pennsylvanicum]